MDEQRRVVNGVLEEVEPFLEKARFLKKGSLNFRKEINTLRQRLDTGSGFKSSFDVITGYTTVVESLLNISSEAVNQETIGGIGKVMFSTLILEGAQEVAGRFWGLISGIVASDQRITDKDVLFTLLGDFDKIELNLTNPALIYTEQMKSVIDSILLGAEYPTLRIALLEVVEKSFQGEGNQVVYQVSSIDLWKSGTKIVETLNKFTEDTLLELRNRS